MRFKYKGFWSCEYQQCYFNFYDNETFTKFCKYCDKYNLEIDKVECIFKHFRITAYFKYYNNLEFNKIKRYYKVFEKKYA